MTLETGDIFVASNGKAGMIGISEELGGTQELEGQKEIEMTAEKQKRQEHF